ncbi:hypothetical protein N0V88_004369 [Collariella sp. IMI 366227]|nr:hypothetical protein N0V88_004369 [Collariella sp. IMI 366227]
MAIPPTAPLAVVTAAEVAEAVTIAAATINRTPATPTASSLPTVLRVPRPTTLRLPSPPTLNRRSSGIPSMHSNTRSRARRMLCRLKTTTPTTPLRYISSSRSMPVSLHTSPLPQPPYGQPYAAPAPQPGPPAQQWGAPQPPPARGAYSGGGRGGRGGYNDRGGPKAQMMGPPLRIGFDGNGLQAAPAPVSYPYGGPPAPPAPYPAPYQGYPAPGPYMATPPAFDSHSGHGPRQHGRGGFHQNKSRPHHGGDKNRNRGQNKGQATQTPPTQHQKPDAASAGKKKKRKTNTLGLTPGDESDEDDENEEQRLDEMYGADAPNPKSSSEIAAWIAERRARFPTKAKLEARKTATKTTNGAAAKARDAALEQKAERLRKQLQMVESSIKRKREQQDEGDDMRDLDLSSASDSGREA